MKKSKLLLGIIVCGIILSQFNLIKAQELTATEIKTAALLKLNLTTKEIAAITYQSLNSIKVARYRLRKKLDLAREDNLVAFLTKL